MFKRMGMLFVIFICGFLLIEWISITHPLVLSELFITFVMNPLKFFAASFVLIIGVICTGKYIRELIDNTRNARMKHIHWVSQLISEYIGLLFVILLLFYLGWEQTIIFFSLSFIYGMISVKL